MIVAEYSMCERIYGYQPDWVNATTFDIINLVYETLLRNKFNYVILKETTIERIKVPLSYIHVISNRLTLNVSISLTLRKITPMQFKTVSRLVKTFIHKDF